MRVLARQASQNPDFRLRVAKLYAAGLPSSVGELDAALRRVFVYREEYEEVVRTPEWMLNDLETIGRLEGDCDDISTLVAAVALLAGWRVRFVAIRYSRTANHFEHVFNEVYDGAEWVTVDLTVPTTTTVTALEVMEEYA